MQCSVFTRSGGCSSFVVPSSTTCFTLPCCLFIRKIAHSNARHPFDYVFVVNLEAFENDFVRLTSSTATRRRHEGRRPASKLGSCSICEYTGKPPCLCRHYRVYSHL